MSDIEKVLAAITGLGERIEKVEASQAATTKKMNASEEHMALVEPHAKALEACAAAMRAAGIGGHPTLGHVHACHAMAAHLRAAALGGKLADEWSGYAGASRGEPHGFHAAADEAAKKAADAVKGAVDPEIKVLKDSIASMTTLINDLKANATKTATEPTRKTVTPQISALLAKAGIGIPAEGEKKLTIHDIDSALSKTSIAPITRMEIKNSLDKAGLIAA